MKVPEHKYKCALGAIQPVKIDAEQTKLIGWRKHRILVICADDEKLSWFEKQVVEQIAAKLYGKIKPLRLTPQELFHDSI